MLLLDCFVVVVDDAAVTTIAAAATATIQRGWLFYLLFLQSITISMRIKYRTDFKLCHLKISSKWLVNIYVYCCYCCSAKCDLINNFSSQIPFRCLPFTASPLFVRVIRVACIFWHSESECIRWKAHLVHLMGKILLFINWHRVYRFWCIFDHYVCVLI